MHFIPLLYYLTKAFDKEQPLGPANVKNNFTDKNYVEMRMDNTHPYKSTLDIRPNLTALKLQYPRYI